jgi:hypothetical protein
MTGSTYILSARMDDNSFAWLDGLRRAHFPPERNVLSAHLTMFHRLTLRQIENLRTVPLPAAPIPVRFDGVVMLGFGNAIRVASPELQTLRSAVKAVLGDDISRQDAQRWTPHVTIQNKVTPDAARALHAALAKDFRLRTGSIDALLVWEYLGGPWRLAERIDLKP